MQAKLELEAAKMIHRGVAKSQEDSWQDLEECKAHRGSESRNALVCEKHSCIQLI